MIPLRDNISHKHKPVVTVFLLIVNISVFGYELLLGAEAQSFIFALGFIPGRLFSEVSLSGKVIPLFSNMFLHASFLHLAGNCIYLWVFADNVEDRLGHFRFLGFYLVCGVAASLVHALFNLGSEIPAIGASGAIAGVLGAYFMFFPKARILTLLPIFIFWQIIEIPAFYFLGIWFLLQFIFGICSLGFRQCGGIAFWAHIGGFAMGAILVMRMAKQRRHYRR